MNVTDYLLSRGYRLSPHRDGDPHNKIYYAYIFDRARLKHCECNESVPSLSVSVFSHPVDDGTIREVYGVEIRGKRSGNWVSLEAYSLQSLKEVKLGIRQVRKMWQSL